KPQNPKTPKPQNPKFGPVLLIAKDHYVDELKYGKLKQKQNNNKDDELCKTLVDGLHFPARHPQVRPPKEEL
ncbi:MAG: hypothetical protein P4M11_03765, partial [Candidatus Pacebacteria bacterium]|nr:hypothetical protein [Candidatus Paceibacterota bacterium]